MRGSAHGGYVDVLRRFGKLSLPGALGFALMLFAGLFLAGCSSSGQDGDPVDPSSAPATASASPSDEVLVDESGRVLTAEEVQAFHEATDVVVAYRQTITDLYTGALTDLNDLYQVASGKLLDQNLQNISKALGDGVRGEPVGAELSLVDVAPVSVDLDDETDGVVVRACIDGTAVTDISSDGSSTPGVRERLDYEVRRTTHLPAPGWAVVAITGDADKAERQC